MNIIPNDYGSERSVEIRYTVETLKKIAKNKKVLDVGGIPTNANVYRPIIDTANEIGADYRICDFRGGQYHGDFVTYDFGNEKFDVIMFISVLEHFPQCTESDCVYREGEDRKGFEKALSLLEPGGKIVLTVPFGEHRWQEYHQNYDMEGILELTRGAKIVYQQTHELKGDSWVLTDPADMTHIRYTDRAYGVGCFILEKE